MVKFKTLVLFLFLILCCGCQIEYSLKIDERNLFSEQFRLIAENEEESQELVDDPFPYPTFYDAAFSGDLPEKIDGVSYYATEILKNGRYYEKKFQYQFSVNDYYRATSLHTCYENVRVTENAEAGTVTLSTSPEFLCMASYANLSQVTVRIEVDFPVTISNADQVNGNVYLWNINQTNYQSKGITLTYQWNRPQETEQEEQRESSSVSMPVVFLILGSFFLFLILVFIYNYKQRNHS